MYNECDYFKPVDGRDRSKCIHCVYWVEKQKCCALDAKVLCNNKTALVHEPVPLQRSRGIMGIFK